MSGRPARRRGAAGVRLGDALQQALKSLGRDVPLRRLRALDVWAEAVGPALAAHSRAVGWRGDALVVEVDDPVWAQQLTMLQETLRDAVNQRLDEPIVAGLHFRVRGGPAPAPGHDRRQRRGRPWEVSEPGASIHAARSETAAAGEPDPEAVPPPYRRWLDQVSECGDPELGAVMGRWLLRQLARRTAAGDAGSCPSCGAPVAPPEPGARPEACPACAAEWRPGGQRHRVQALLEEEPWLSAEAVAERLPGCGARIYDDVRGKLLQRWQAEFQELLARLESRRRRRDRAALRRRASVLALRLTCLITGLHPAELSDDMLVQALGPRAQALLADGSDGHLPASGR